MNASKEDFDEILDDGPYWKPEEGKQYTVVLANWRKETTDFGEGESNQKKVMVFDVLNVNGVEYAGTRKTFGTR